MTVTVYNKIILSGPHKEKTTLNQEDAKYLVTNIVYIQWFP